MFEEWEEASMARSDGWCAEHVSVEAAVANQFAVGALFLDHAPIDYNNAVKPVKRGDSVGDKDHCLVPKMVR